MNAGICGTFGCNEVFWVNSDAIIIHGRLQLHPGGLCGTATLRAFRSHSLAESLSECDRMG